MARIRTVKPDFFKHEELYQAEFEEKLPLRLAFIGLWCVCDREGRFKWRPNQLKLDILPYDKSDFSRVLDALATRGFIEQYTSESDELLGFVPTFTIHQVINNRESESTIPSPFDACATRDPHGLSKNKGKGRERKGREGAKSSRLNEVYSEDFLKFWDVYPNKSSKAKANESWLKIKPSLDNVLKTLAWQIKTSKWIENKGEFIPMASTYINQQRWLDEPNIIDLPKRGLSL